MGGYRVEFELTDDDVRSMEEAVESMDNREDGTVRVEHRGEVVFDGPISPSLWQDIRTGDFSELEGTVSVTGLDDETADELVELLSEG